MELYFIPRPDCEDTPVLILRRKFFTTEKDRRARKNKSRMSFWCKAELEKGIRIRRRHKRIGRNRKKNKMK